jgi:hypothetical protein
METGDHSASFNEAPLLHFCSPGLCVHTDDRQHKADKGKPHYHCLLLGNDIC